MSTPSLYLKEFPGFVLDVTIPESFTDISWHNDTMPSFQTKVASGWLRLWIDYIHEHDRECTGGKRFLLALYDEDEEWISEIVSSDDFAEIEAAIALHSDLLTEKGN